MGNNCKLKPDGHYVLHTGVHRAGGCEGGIEGNEVVGGWLDAQSVGEGKCKAGVCDRRSDPGVLVQMLLLECSQ